MGYPVLLQLRAGLTAESLLGEMDADSVLDYWLGECVWLGMNDPSRIFGCAADITGCSRCYWWALGQSIDSGGHFPDESGKFVDDRACFA